MLASHSLSATIKRLSESVIGTTKINAGLQGSKLRHASDQSNLSARTQHESRNSRPPGRRSVQHRRGKEEIEPARLQSRQVHAQIDLDRRRLALAEYPAQNRPEIERNAILDEICARYAGDDFSPAH